MRIELNSDSVTKTIAIGASIGQRLKGGEVIELVSDLGGGKTTIVKGIVKGSGSKELVSSPSFTITNEYICPKFQIFHFDFYRLNDPGIIRRELNEIIKETADVAIIEWPAVIEDILPSSRLVIKISSTNENDRIIKLNCPQELSYLIEGIK